MRRAITAILFLCLLPCFAATWYVDADATGANNGTSWTDAWESFGDIAWGAGGVVAGDTLAISGGVYTGTMAIGASGNPGAPITITASAEVGHNDQVVVNVGGATGFNLGSRSNIVINGVRGNAVAGDTNYGILMTNLTAGAGGVYSVDQPRFISVFHVQFIGSGGAGDDQSGPICISGKYITVGFCHIWGASDSFWHVSGITIWQPSPSDVDTYTNTLIFSNRIANLYHDGIKSGHNFSAFGNEVSGIHGSGHSDSILAQSGDFVKLYGNFIHDSNDQNIYLDNLNASTNGSVLIYNNVINSPGGFGIVLDAEGPDTLGTSCAWSNVVIANNTIPACAGECVKEVNRGNYLGLVMKNNIFGIVTNDNTKQALFYTSRTTWADANAWDYNLYLPGCVMSPNIAVWDNLNRTLAELRGSTPAREANGKSQLTPTWDANYRLLPSDTAARDSGADLSALFTTDFLGNTRIRWDIGAYAGPSKTIRATTIRGNLRGPY